MAQPHSYLLGDHVRIELVPRPRSEDIVENPTSSSSSTTTNDSFSLNLVGFTGCLHVTLLDMTQVQAQPKTVQFTASHAAEALLLGGTGIGTGNHSISLYTTAEGVQVMPTVTEMEPAHFDELHPSEPLPLRMDSTQTTSAETSSSGKSLTQQDEETATTIMVERTSPSTHLDTTTDTMPSATDNCQDYTATFAPSNRNESEFSETEASDSLETLRPTETTTTVSVNKRKSFQAMRNFFDQSRPPSSKDGGADPPTETTTDSCNTRPETLESSLSMRSTTSSISVGSPLAHAASAVVGGLTKPFKSKWASLLRASQVRHQIPSKVKERRLLLRQALLSSKEPPPTKLHALCAKPDVTLDQLYAAMHDEPDAVSIQDSAGCLPLHILADNDSLLREVGGREICTTVSLQFIKAHPDSLTTEDNQGFMPFFIMIRDWMEWIYESDKKSSKNTASGAGGLAAATNRFMKKKSRSKSDTNGGSGGDGSSRDAIAAASGGLAQTMADIVTRASVMAASTRKFPQAASLWEEVEWSFSMLSLALDELAGKSGGLHKRDRRIVRDTNEQDKTARNVLVNHLVYKIPALIKTILLLEGEGGEARRRLLRMSLFRRILVCSHAVGPWLIGMLHKKGVPSERAVDYLNMISETTPIDFFSEFRSALPEDIDAFYEERRCLFDNVGELDGIIASLVVLDEREKERAASTPVVWHTMNKNLQRPFVVGLVLIDLSLHLTLMLAFRNDVQFSNGGTDTAIGAVPRQVVLVICCHYIIRKAGEAFSLWSLSHAVFMSFFTNMWTLFDFFAITLTMAAVVYNDNNPSDYRNGFNAFVLGLLWLKVLGFLKVVNKQMSTFILALFQILRDIKYFGLVLVVFISMFGDMFHIALATKDNGEFCPDNKDELSGPADDFCSYELYNSYLRVYALLLGDFELDDFRESSGMTILFVMFTALGVVILLNVLIAVNQALESFLRPGTDPTDALKAWNNSSKLIGVASRFARWLVLVTLIGTAFDAEVYLVLRAVVLIRDKTRILTATIVTILAVILTIALWVIVGFSIEDLIRKYAPEPVVRVFNAVDGCTEFYARLIGTRLFGLEDTIDGETETEEEWTGRLLYLEKVFERTIAASETHFNKSMAQVKDQLTAEIVALEKRLYQHQKETDTAL